MVTKEQHIPKGWSVKKLEECFCILKTSNYSRAETQNSGGIYYIHYGDIHTKYPLHTSPANINLFITEDKGTRFDIIKNGDLIMLDASEDYEGATKCIEMTNITSEKIISGLHTIALRDRGENFANLFKAYLLSMPFVKNNFLRQITGIKVYGISKTNLQKINLLIPPLPEQEKIVEILGVWDDGIEKFSKLVKEKKKLKKGLMQRLLTGNQRLKGFSEPWKEVKLGNIGSTFNGLSGKNKDDFGYGSPFIPYMNIYKNYKIEPKNVELVEITDNEDQHIVKFGDIFFTTSSETPEEVGFSSALLYNPSEPTYLNSFCFGYRLNNFESLLPGYAAYFFRSSYMRRIMYKLAQGATRFNLSKNNLMKEEILIPSSLPEQKAIADILSKQDEEIELLTKKLEMLKQQKKGLMQQLLTGKTRVKVN